MLGTARIRELAYRLWEDEGRPTDRELEHWLQAERLISSVETAAPAAAKKPAPRPRKKAGAKKQLA